MKKRILVVTVFLFTFFILSCHKTSSPEPSPCGTALDKQQTLMATGDLVFDNNEWNEENILTTLNGDERTFTTMLSQSDLCPQKLIDINFEVNTTSAPGTMVALSITGTAKWGEGNSELVNICNKSDGNMKADYEYKSVLTANLKPAYNNSSGSLKALLTISFHSLGSTTMDTLYFRSKFKDLNISISGSSIK